MTGEPVGLCPVRIGRRRVESEGIVNVDKSPPIREYVGVIWIEDKPGIRLRIPARSLDEARSWAIEKYGEGHVISIWNEGDASSAR